jgi:hypothetical protein
MIRYTDLIFSFSNDAVMNAVKKQIFTISSGKNKDPIGMNDLNNYISLCLTNVLLPMHLKESK